MVYFSMFGNGRIEIQEDQIEIKPEYDCNASRVYGDIWIGSAPPPGTPVSTYFDCLVLAAKQYQVKDCFYDVECIQIPLEDINLPLSIKDKKNVIRTAGVISKWHNQGMKVLVTCMAGLNRSSLCVAVALCKGLKVKKPDQVINLIRQARGQSALSNPQFVQFLYDYCSEIQ